jgi:hypothetical protein
VDTLSVPRRLEQAANSWNRHRQEPQGVAIAGPKDGRLSDALSLAMTIALASLGQLEPRGEGHGQPRALRSAPLGCGSYAGGRRAGTATPVAAVGCANGGRAGRCGGFGD